MKLRTVELHITVILKIGNPCQKVLRLRARNSLEGIVTLPKGVNIQWILKSMHAFFRFNTAHANIGLRLRFITNR